VSAVRQATLRLSPLGFARGFGKTGQAFSKSARSGAPQLFRSMLKDKPALFFPVKVVHPPPFLCRVARLGAGLYKRGK